MTNAVINWIRSWHLGLALIIFFAIAVSFSMFQPAPAQTPLNGAAVAVVESCYEDFLGQKANKIGGSADICDHAMGVIQEMCKLKSLEKSLSVCDYQGYKDYIKAAGL